MNSEIGYLLDTCVLLQIIRDNPIGKKIVHEFHLTQNLTECAICIVTVGEIYSMAKRRNWGKSKINTMMRLLSHLLILGIDSEDVLEAYADIDNTPQSSGLGKNDLWIAAVAKVTQFTLLTADKSFKQLLNLHINGFLIDPNTKKDT